MMPEQFKKMYAESIKARDEVLEALEPLRAEEADLQDELDAIMEKLKAVREKIVEHEREGGLAEATRTIAVLAPRAKHMEAESGSYGIKESE